MGARYQQSIDNYLDAIGLVHGAEYREQMSVSLYGGQYYRIKHPHESDGTLVPLAHLDNLTRNLLKYRASHG